VRNFNPECIKDSELTKLKHILLEKDDLERMVNDEEGFTEDLFKTIKKYLPEIKVSFMR